MNKLKWSTRFEFAELPSGCPVTVREAELAIGQWAVELGRPEMGNSTIIRADFESREAAKAWVEEVLVP